LERAIYLCKDNSGNYISVFREISERCFDGRKQYEMDLDRSSIGLI
jgi:hypothetical protein